MVTRGKSTDRASTIQLKQVLTERFNEEELRELCFELGVDYDSLPGEGKGGKARELVAHFERREAITELVEGIRRLRPDALVSPGGSSAQFLKGAVLYASMPEFATLSLDKQDLVTEFLKKEIDGFLNDFGPAYWLDFRGGDFLFFLEHTPSHRDREADTLARTLMFGAHIQSHMQALGPDFQLGVTLDWENSAQQHHLGGRLHLVGHALNEAPLLMSFSDSKPSERGHFFISQEAYNRLQQQLVGRARPSFDELIAAMRNRLSQQQIWLFPEDSVFQCNEFLFHDQHKRQHPLYNLYTPGGHGGQMCVGNPVLPRQRVAIEYREKRTAEPDQVFMRRLIEANEITIIGLTHEGTAMFLEEALRIRQERGQGFWNKLQIIFPSESFLDTVIEQESALDNRLDRWLGGRRTVITFLMAQGLNCRERWECLEFGGNLPFIGNWFTGRKNNSVRVAPVLPGCDMRESYYIEVFEGMEAYNQLSQAFDVICRRGSRIVEWDVYGEWDDKGQAFHYRGIVNRKNWDQLAEEGTQRGVVYCFPVVLVMLYADIGGRLKSFLQKRTLFNAADDLEKFSNISGRITDMDVYSILDPAPDIRFGLVDIADDIATNEFNRLTGLAWGDPLPLDTWKAAAIREVQEELGLKITPDRLRHHCMYPLKRKNRYLLFHIFSLKLRRDRSINELDMIERLRPYSELSPFDLSQLESDHDQDKFNRLLQQRFEQVFLPIFEELGIR